MANKDSNMYIISQIVLGILLASLLVTIFSWCKKNEERSKNNIEWLNYKLIKIESGQLYVNSNDTIKAVGNVVLGTKNDGTLVIGVRR